MPRVEDPFQSVASGLNRDLAWITGGLVALGGAVVTASYVAVEILLRRHRTHGQPSSRGV